MDEFCFNNESAENNDAILEKIMSYTFSSSGQKTREFSPIGEEADESPIIRSFILQQLMKRYISVVLQYF